MMAGYGGVAVMVTHDRDEAYQLCDNLLLMDRGRVLAEGRTQGAVSEPGDLPGGQANGLQKHFPDSEGGGAEASWPWTGAVWSWRQSCPWGMRSRRWASGPTILNP